MSKEITATELDVAGISLKDLDGVYIRNGHNPIFQPASGRYHWFDGDSMVHATTFKDGKAEYRNRMVLTAGLLKEMGSAKALYPGLRDGFEAEGGLKNNSGTDVVLHNGEFKTMFSVVANPTDWIRLTFIPLARMIFRSVATWSLGAFQGR
ncbi:MAG: carotenoid oxygenase family protein [Leptospiraceae bacterium]|nr:carotenoid oxygenase family protein [Leptospiraceae bacterium]